jgi:glutamate-5-semialdehyde dehydrogenase
MKTGITELEEKGRAARVASKKLAFLPTEIKNKALLAIAKALKAREREILSANSQDYQESEA